MQSVTQTDCVGPLLWNVVVSKTKHSKTKTEARSTQISKTKHPKLETCLSYKNTRQSLFKSLPAGIGHDNK